MGAFMSYEVQGICQNNNLPLNCKVQFDGLKVTSYGNVEQGGFEADPDIAGKGVLLAFIIPEIILLVFVFFIVFSRTNYIWDTSLARPTVNAWFIRRITTTLSFSYAEGYESGMINTGLNSGFGGGATGPYQQINDDYYPRPQYPSSSGNSQSGFYNGHGSQYHSGYGEDVSESIPMTQPVTSQPPQRLDHHPRRPYQPHNRPTITQKWHLFWQTTAVWLEQHIFERFSPGTESIPIEEEKSIGEKLYNFFEVALLAVSDSQLLLGMAQVISFGFLGRCETSRYHYTIAMQVVLLACWSALIAMVLVRRYWKAPFAALVRVIFFVVLALALAYYYEKQLRYDEAPLYRQQWDRKDSLIFLPGSCFLDPDLRKETFDPLTPEQLDAVGWAHPWTSVDFISYVVLCVCGVMALIVLFVRLCRDVAGVEDGYTKRINNRLYQIFVTLYWTIPYIVGLGFYIYAFIAIFDLRDWVYASGWMEMPDGAKEEQEVRGLGQIAPIVATFAVVIAVCDKWEKLPRIK